MSDTEPGVEPGTTPQTEVVLPHKAEAKPFGFIGGGWYALAVLIGFVVGGFFPSTLTYFAAAAATGLATFLFYRHTKYAAGVPLAVLVLLTFLWIGSVSRNWDDSVQHTQDRKVREEQQEVAAVEKVMRVVYSDTFNTTEIATYGPHVDFETRDGGCLYRVPYIELDEPGSYGLVEGKEELLEVVPQIADGYAVQPGCDAHPLKAARERQPG